MKRRVYVALSVLLMVTMACGFNLDLGNSGSNSQPNSPTQPPAVVTVVVQPTAAPVSDPSTATAAPVTDPPMVTATRPTDCLPYPRFGFMYLDGIETDMTVAVIAKSEPQLGDQSKGEIWYEVEFDDGGAHFKCWVYSRFFTTIGDFSKLTVHSVIIPDKPPKPHCDTDVKVAKARVGVKVRLPYNPQREWLGHTGWFYGMAEYAGKIAHITYVLPYWDISGCKVVYVDIDGGDYGWRVRDLDFSVAKPE